MCFQETLHWNAATCIISACVAYHYYCTLCPLILCVLVHACTHYVTNRNVVWPNNTFLALKVMGNPSLPYIAWLAGTYMNMHTQIEYLYISQSHTSTFIPVCGVTINCAVELVF